MFFYKRIKLYDDTHNGKVSSALVFQIAISRL